MYRDRKIEREYYRKYYLRNREKRLAQSKEWRKKHPRILKTNWVYSEKRCRFCLSKNSPLMIQSRTKGGIYYSCRKCNTSRFQKYRKTKNGSKRVYLACKRFEKRYPEKRKAWSVVHYNLRIQKIKKPKKCESCSKSKRLEAHHENYSRPLEVVWLCRQCHSEV